MYSRVNPAYRNYYLSSNTADMLKSLSSFHSSNSQNSVGSLNSLGSLSSVNSLSGLDYYAQKAAGDLNALLQGNEFKVDPAVESSEAKNYLTTIKAASQTMKSAIGSLMGTTQQSAFQQLSPVSSDPAKLKVESTSQKPATFSAMDIRIDQIASGQVNQGAALTAGSQIGQPAIYEFQIENDGKSYSFSIVTSPDDTNKALQDKIADAVNKKNMGLTALVEYDAKNKTSSLTIQSKETGANAKNQFTIRDTYGDAISRTGAGDMTRQAQDAIYRINDGSQKASASNTVDLGNGIKATLLEASDSTIRVSMKADGSEAVKAVKKIADSYNSLVTAAKSADTPKSLQLNVQLARITNTYAPSLSRIGVTMEPDGTMSINQDKLKSSADNGELKNLFNQDRYTNYGFANRMNRLASEVNASPMKFTSLSSLGLSDYSSNLYSPFLSSKYNQVYNTGLFLNMFV